MNLHATIQGALQDARKALSQFIHDAETVDTIQSVAHLMRGVFDNQGRVFACGNGGSMCDALHFAEECTGRFRKDRAPLPVIALGEASHLTCVANDYGFDQVFARPLAALAHPGDLLVAISTSGNSTNVLRAVEVAQAKDVTVFGLLGKDGGKIQPLCDVCLIAPGDTTDRIQEIHMLVLHILVESIERLMFPENYA